MIVRSLIKCKTYQDSVKLMKLSSVLAAQDGVLQASVVMATDMNKDVLNSTGLLLPEVAQATPNDLAIVIAAEQEEVAMATIEKAEQLLSEASGTTGKAREVYPKTVRSALNALPGANLVLISVPGTYAAAEARKALESGLHVHMFSDNVSLEEEKELKEIAVSKGLLMMGPDCGTAIINNTPLAFANVVNRGPIGIVGASGTGIQQGTVLIDRLGSGISHAIGTGGRDLSDHIGGLMMLTGFDYLENDPETKVILLISKPAGPQTTEKLLSKIKASTKPVVVSLIKGDLTAINQAGGIGASTIEDAVYQAVAVANGEEPRSIPLNYWGDNSEQIAAAKRQLAGSQKYLRGLFTGGTLADEAMVILRSAIGDVYSNIPLNKSKQLADAKVSKEHTVIDLGDDEFTNGRPHPMIDPQPRNERVLKEFVDPEVAVLLCDVVLGYGSHDDPAQELAAAVMQARTLHPGSHPVVVTFVCGTEKDPQVLSHQVTILKQAGIIVLESNAAAAGFAAALLPENAAVL
ncbi:Protein FdrA [Sporomusa rhizae]|uniref:acyl-CoA synthetase FdrA n=1 Tax=Sporomusa rhizae TaxID=357999 RepID=UPI00352A0BD6